MTTNKGSQKEEQSSCLVRFSFSQREAIYFNLEMYVMHRMKEAKFQKHYHVQQKLLSSTHASNIYYSHLESFQMTALNPAWETNPKGN
jgi:hypothetical protein